MKGNISFDGLMLILLLWLYLVLRDIPFVHQIKATHYHILKTRFVNDDISNEELKRLLKSAN